MSTTERSFLKAGKLMINFICKEKLSGAL